MTIKRTRFEVGVEVTPTSVPLTREGEIRSNESSKELEVFLDEETRIVVTENQEQVLENKEIDADLNAISNLEVDNLKAGVLNVDPNLTGATNQQLPSALVVKNLVTGINTELQSLQDQIDATSQDLSSLTDRVSQAEQDIDDTELLLNSHINATTDAHDASAISITPISGVVGNNVQESLESIKSLVDDASKSKGITKVRLLDSASTTLPLGSVVVDNVSVVNGDKVLFTNLSIDPNRIYSAVATGSNVTSWVLEEEFSGTTVPSEGDYIVVLEGALFGSQLGNYVANKFEFNNKVRYFNGNDYFEQSSLLTSTLLDNQTTPQVATEFNYLGSEYSIIECSISRGSAKEVLILIVTTDGTNVSMAQHGSSLENTGITLTADINSGKLRILYTSTSNGLDATMKFNVRRWSNSAGGPSGLPSYSGAAPVEVLDYDKMSIYRSGLDADNIWTIVTWKQNSITRKVSTLYKQGVTSNYNRRQIQYYSETGTLQQTEVFELTYSGNFLQNEVKI